jgi:hypothetical protein
MTIEKRSESTSFLYHITDSLDPFAKHSGKGRGIYRPNRGEHNAKGVHA